MQSTSHVSLRHTSVYLTRQSTLHVSLPHTSVYLTCQSTSHVSLPHVSVYPTRQSTPHVSLPRPVYLTSSPTRQSTSRASLPHTSVYLMCQSTPPVSLPHTSVYPTRQSTSRASLPHTSVYLMYQSTPHVSLPHTSVYLTRQSTPHVSLPHTSVYLTRQSTSHALISPWSKSGPDGPGPTLAIFATPGHIGYPWPYCPPLARLNVQPAGSSSWRGRWEERWVVGVVRWRWGREADQETNGGCRALPPSPPAWNHLEEKWYKTHADETMMNIGCWEGEGEGGRREGLREGEEREGRGGRKEEVTAGEEGRGDSKRNREERRREWDKGRWSEEVRMWEMNEKEERGKTKGKEKMEHMMETMMGRREEAERGRKRRFLAVLACWRCDGPGGGRSPVRGLSRPGLNNAQAEGRPMPRVSPVVNTSSQPSLRGMGAHRLGSRPHYH
ncbi:hypothetical protein Hamer_G009859 [Homarus americanus]|uniref:Uncharacterized protein n=1 Tax=Homarus americanus TaxID=6706 RepID=A0A8J5N8I2_HOMAM|nr:hypothetical protein Hamer_G009859 [Homarus americanus]